MKCKICGGNTFNPDYDLCPDCGYKEWRKLEERHSKKKDIQRNSNHRRNHEYTDS